MRKGDVINGYKVLEDFTVAGGQSIISFAEKGGKEFFIKKFLSPRYPVEGSPGSPTTRERRRKKCVEFEKHHNRVNSKIKERVGKGGNLVYAIDFFRDGSSYFKINQKVDVSSVSIKDISKLPIDKQVLIMKTVSHSLNILHSIKIIHGDLKPDNILIKQTKTKNYTSKLIDFDDSYFEDEIPKSAEDVIGTPNYYSPELGYYIVKEEDADQLTTQSDVFAMGVVFTQYLTGDYPKFDKSKYDYAWEAVLDGQELKLTEKGIPDSLKQIVNEMLLLDYKKRPSIFDVFNRLKTYDKVSPASSTSKDGGGKLKGTLLESIKEDKEKDSSKKKIEKKSKEKPSYTGKLGGSLLKDK